MLLERLKERTSLLLVLFLSIFITNLTLAAEPTAKRTTGAVDIAPEEEEIDTRVENLVKNTLGVNKFWVSFLNGVRSDSNISLLKVMPTAQQRYIRNKNNIFANSNLSVLQPADTRYVVAAFSSKIAKDAFARDYLSQLRRSGLANTTQILGLALQKPYRIEVRLNKPNFKVDLDSQQEYRREIWNKITKNRDFIYNLKPGEFDKNLDNNVQVKYKESKTRLIRLLASLIDKSGIEDIDSIRIVTNSSRLLNQQMIILEFSASYDNLLTFINKANSNSKYLLLTCGVIIEPKKDRHGLIKGEPKIKLLLSFPYRSTEFVDE